MRSTSSEPAEVEADEDAESFVETVETLEKAQSYWDSKIQSYVPKAKSRARLMTPLKPKEMLKWMANETRPIPVTFYDGKVDAKRLKLAIARGQVIPDFGYWQEAPRDAA